MKKQKSNKIIEHLNKVHKIPMDAINKIMLTKEAIASCELDGCTQCGDMTIEPNSPNKSESPCVANTSGNSNKQVQTGSDTLSSKRKQLAGTGAIYLEEDVKECIKDILEFICHNDDGYEDYIKDRAGDKLI